MGNDTTITVRGRSGSVPTLYGTEQRWTWFRLVTTRTYRLPDGTWAEDRPMWFTVRAQGALALSVSQVVRSGTPLVVRGRLGEETWIDRAGQERHGASLRADAIGVDILSRGHVTYTVPARRDDASAAGGSDGAAADAGARDLASQLGEPPQRVLIDGVAYDSVGSLAAGLGTGGGAAEQDGSHDVEDDEPLDVTGLGEVEGEVEDEEGAAGVLEEAPF